MIMLSEFNSLNKSWAFPKVSPHDPHAGQHGIIYAHELHDFPVVLLVCVNCDKEHLALVVLGNISQDIHLN